MIRVVSTANMNVVYVDQEKKQPKVPFWCVCWIGFCFMLDFSTIWNLFSRYEENQFKGEIWTPKDSNFRLWTAASTQSNAFIITAQYRLTGIHWVTAINPKINKCQYGLIFPKNIMPTYFGRILRKTIYWYYSLSRQSGEQGQSGQSVWF